MKTLTDIRNERGEEVHGWVLIVTGAAPADPAEARRIGERINTAVNLALGRIEESSGAEMMSLTLRMETYENYVKGGMPNAGQSVPTGTPQEQV